MTRDTRERPQVTRAGARVLRAPPEAPTAARPRVYRARPRGRGRAGDPGPRLRPPRRQDSGSGQSSRPRSSPPEDTGRPSVQWDTPPPGPCPARRTPSRCPTPSAPKAPPGRFSNGCASTVGRSLALPPSEARLTPLLPATPRPARTPGTTCRPKEGSAGSPGTRRCHPASGLRGSAISEAPQAAAGRREARVQSASRAAGAASNQRRRPGSAPPLAPAPASGSPEAEPGVLRWARLGASGTWAAAPRTDTDPDP